MPGAGTCQGACQGTFSSGTCLSATWLALLPELRGVDVCVVPTTETSLPSAVFFFGLLVCVWYIYIYIFSRLMRLRAFVVRAYEEVEGGVVR